MVQLVQVVDELLSAHLGRLAAAVYTVIALGVFGVQGCNLGLLVALLLKRETDVRWVTLARVDVGRGFTDSVFIM